MKIVGNEFRVVRSDEERLELYKRAEFFRCNEDNGPLTFESIIYEHLGRYYRLLGKMYFILYLEEIVKPLEVGIKLPTISEKEGNK